jgi:PAS domain S-box-containing protein
MPETRAVLARREEELRRSHALLDAIAEIQSLFIRDAKSRELFDAVLAILLRITDSGYGFVGEVLYADDGAPYLRTFSLTNIAWNEETRALYKKYEQTGLEFRNLDTLFGVSLRSGETVISNDPASDPRSSGRPEGHPPLDSYLGMPVFAGGGMVGLIGLANRPGGYDQALVEYLHPLASTCGHIIEAFRGERERRQAVDALHETLALQDAILRGAGHAIISTDMVGTILTFNPAAARMLGYQPDELIGRSSPALLHDPEEVERRAAELSVELGRPVAPGFEVFVARALAGEVEEREWTYIRKDGSRLPVQLVVSALRDAHGAPTGFLGIASDISERKQAQTQLTRLTGELRAILNLSPDGFVAFNETGRIKYANPAFHRMCGFADQDLVGMHETEFDAMLAVMCDSKQPYTPIAEMDENQPDILSRAKPRPTVARRSMRRLVDNEGRHLGRVVYFQDLTQESELDRMKTEFMSAAAHELRTPLASIHGFSELLLKREFDADTRRDMVQTIHRQSSNLVRLVNELLDLARIEARAGKDFHIRTQSVLPIVDNTLRHFMMPDDPRKVALHLSGRLPDVAVDADKLEQALLNLLSNAYKYSPGGGTIELETLTRRLGGKTEVGIAVRDHGIGMTTEQVARIFERFYRADFSGVIPGTGLGMSLVKEIMDILQGTVEIDSAPGCGTTVVLWLPAANA